MSKRIGISRPLGLALVLAIGFGAVFAIAAGWGISIWEGLHEENVSEHLQVRADGTPLIVRYTYKGYQVVTYHALNGSAVTDLKEDVGWLQGAFLAKPREERFAFPMDGSARIKQFGDVHVQMPPKVWYFIDDGARDGHGYFVGYDSENKLRLGFIGRDGFRPDRPPVEEWFPMDGVKLASRATFYPLSSAYYYSWDADDNTAAFPAWKVDMISGTQLLEVDLLKGSVTTIMESADLLAVAALTGFTSKVSGHEGRRSYLHLAVRTADRILIFDAPGKQHSVFPLPEEFRGGDITLYELDSGTALVNVRRMLPDRTSLEGLIWIDKTGKVLRREEVTLGKGNAFTDETSARKCALAVPSPLALALVAMVGPPFYRLSNGLAPDYATALTQSLAVFWPVLLVVTLLSAVLAWYCFRRHRRYVQPSGVVWFVFVLFTGLPGLVGYLFHRRWPVLEKCPACGHVVPRDRETCAKCGTAFPPPAPKGCEVFA